MTGLHLAHYRIEAELGRGGMGIVYRATDTKLNRTVALKVLPAAALSSDDDRARFFREAQAAAQFSHPNVCHIYQVDEAIPTRGGTPDGVSDAGLVEMSAVAQRRPFIAMEFVEGETLQARIARAPLKLAEAVRFGIQVAEALRAAHAKNIVHRDIKSANVMLTPEGVAKVLDFGLAKTNQSTILTRLGSTVGTVAYMSPEQARGETVDGRSDLYSLGTVLFEMVSGRLPFGGDYEQAVVYGILNEAPESLTSLRTGVPMDLERIVEKLLSKEPRQRYQAAADLIVDLEAVDVGASARHIAPPAPVKDLPGARRSIRGLLIPTTVSFVAGALLFFAVTNLWPESEGATVRAVQRMNASVEAGAAIVSVDFSSDGRTLVYATADNAHDNVFVREMATGVTRALPGSAGTSVVAVSPDGEWVLTTKQLTVERTSLRAGAPLLVVEAEEGQPRAEWGPEGWVVFEDTQALWKVSTETREKRPLTIRDTTAHEQDHDWPQLLPDGRSVMATVEYDVGPPAVGIWDFETGERLATVPSGGYAPLFSPTGHLVFVIAEPGEAGALVALEFDPRTLTTTGSLVPVAASVGPGTVSFSNGGTLVYGLGDLELGGFVPPSRLVVSTFPGSSRVLSFPPAGYSDIELGADDARAVVTISDPASAAGVGNGTDVYVLDLERGARVQLSHDLSGGWPTWYPAGDSVLYVDLTRHNAGDSRVMVCAADGSGEARTLFSSALGLSDLDLSPDGRWLVYAIGADPYGATRIEARSLVTGETVELTDRRIANRRNPRYSPDGRTVVYEENGQVFSRSADGIGLPVNISTGTASQARWSRDGGSLYFMIPGSILRARLGRPGGEMDVLLQAANSVTSFDVFADGTRLLLADPSQVADPESLKTGAVRSDATEFLTFVVNWFEELQGVARR